MVIVVASGAHISDAIYMGYLLVCASSSFIMHEARPLPTDSAIIVL